MYINQFTINNMKILNINKKSECSYTTNGVFDFEASMNCNGVLFTINQKEVAFEFNSVFVPTIENIHVYITDSIMKI